MKNLVLLLVAVMSACFAVNAQTEPDWSRAIQLTSYNFPAGRIVASDAENIYMAGYFSGPITFNNTVYTSTGLTDLIVIKVNSSGTFAWAKQFNADVNGIIRPDALKVDADYNIYLAGTFTGTISSGNGTITSNAVTNAFIAKIDANGNDLWASSFTASGSGSSKIVCDESGSIYLINKSRTLIKFNSSGNKEWEQNYPDRTLQAIAVNSHNLFIGGALQPGTTSFGSFDLKSSNAYNTGFMAKADLDGVYTKTLVEGTSTPSKAGTYHAVGTFIHPTSGTRTINLDKTLSESEPDVLSTTVGDLGAASGTLILTIRPDDSVTISGSVGATPLVQSGVNYYDPLTNSFTLHYSYTTTGTRIISEVLTLSASSNTGDGSSITDFAIDNSGNIIVTGAYTKDLVLDNITITNPNSSHYTYISKCDTNFVFSWTTSSDAIAATREMYAYRLFQDNANNIYQYGISNYGATTFTYETISVVQKTQFLFKFDANGAVLKGYEVPLYTGINRIAVATNGQIISTEAVVDDMSQRGNFSVNQYNNDMSPDWHMNSSNHQAGNNYVNFVKHDNIGNTYIQAYVQGFSNFFGTVINSNQGTTVNAKLDKSGNALWVDQINDLNPNSEIYGPKFTLDKDNNLFTKGAFNTTVTVGTQNLTNSDASEDSYVVKYSSTGQVLWAVQLAASGVHSVYGVTTDKTGNVIVSGKFKNLLTVSNKTIDAGTGEGAFILKFDASGNCLWANGYPVGNLVYSAMVATDGADNIYMSGEMYNSATNQLIFGSVTIPQTNNDGGTVLVKLNPDGTPLWGYTYGGVTGGSNPDGWPVDIKSDSAGNSYLYGVCANNASFGNTTLTNPVGSSYSFYLTKINTNGEVVWADAMYKNAYSFIIGDWLDMDKKGNIYAGGYFNDPLVIQGNTYHPVSLYDIFVTKYNNDGVFQWIKTIPNKQQDNTGSLSVFDEDVLSITANWATDLTLAKFGLEYKGNLTGIIATLGILEPLPNTLFVDFIEGSETAFSFTSNTDWTVTSDQEWLTISSNSGSGNGTLTFTASENSTGEARTAIVTITFLGTKTQSITLTIIQEATSTGITDLIKMGTLVYPNPASTNLYVNSDVQNAIISIYDSKGKMVFNRQNYTSEINISNLRNGIYTIRMVSEAGIKIQKFIKQ